MEYTDELGTILCERYFLHGLSFNKISKMPNMPSQKQILRWLMDVPAFASLFNRTRDKLKDYKTRSTFQDLLEDTPEAIFKRIREDESFTDSEVRDLTKLTVKSNQDKINVMMRLLEVDDPERYTKRLDINHAVISSWDIQSIGKAIALLPPDQVQLLKEALNYADSRPGLPELPASGGGLFDVAAEELSTMPEMRDGNDTYVYEGS